nr:hypothetical protein [uncultured bacterium]
MGDPPLRAPTYRCLGKPLPYQLTNRTHTHLIPPKLYYLYNAILIDYKVLIFISKGYPSV